MNALPRYTWDQAAILNVWSPDAFAAIGIKPATIRKWASRDKIRPVGQGPNGCKLYSYESVVQHADRESSSELEHMPTICHTENTGG